MTDLTFDHIRQAVILAAGCGNRLASVLPDRPKGLLELNGLPIIERSIMQLIALGIDDIVVVTGFAANYYAYLAHRFHQIQLIINHDYAQTNSMTSLACAKDSIHGSFLLLESDLIYEQRGLEVLMAVPKANAILTSGFTYSDDEVYVSAQDGRIVELAKQPSQQSDVVGELVGISKISGQMYRAMLAFYEANTQPDKKLDYEGCITGIASDMPISPCLVKDLIWAEIDTPEHLARVKQHILPKLVSEWSLEKMAL
ncbi:MAG: phosphocholine cytidylyltransferase family protein [Chloroflexota bacterium]